MGKFCETLKTQGEDARHRISWKCCSGNQTTLLMKFPWCLDRTSRATPAPHALSALALGCGSRPADAAGRQFYSPFSVSCGAKNDSEFTT